jgi:hypothetical protein
MLRSLLTAAVIASLALPVGAEAKRNLTVGDCGTDVVNVKQRLVEMKMLPAAQGRCLGNAAGYALDAFQKYAGLQRDRVVGPKTRAALKAARTPAHIIPRRGGSKTRIEIWINRQLAVMIKNNRIFAIYSISSGMPGYETPSGRYTVYRKEEMSWSVPYSVWLPWASYFNGGIALHQSDSIPPYPASRGCVRVPAPWAKKVYDFADYGRVILVR